MIIEIALGIVLGVILLALLPVIFEAGIALIKWGGALIVIIGAIALLIYCVVFVFQEPSEAFRLFGAILLLCALIFGGYLVLASLGMFTMFVLSKAELLDARDCEPFPYKSSISKKLAWFSPGFARGYPFILLIGIIVVVAIEAEAKIAEKLSIPNPVSVGIVLIFLAAAVFSLRRLRKKMLTREATELDPE
jgi:hypothetical protein